MWLLLTTLWIVGSVLDTQAQDEAFKPYQATLDQMPIEEAEPRIIQHYGAIGQRSQGVDALTVSLKGQDLSITYWTGGDIGPRIELTYPTEPFRTFDSAALCARSED